MTVVMDTNVLMSGIFWSGAPYRLVESIKCCKNVIEVITLRDGAI